jgi:hypothetical protein
LSKYNVHGRFHGNEGMLMEENEDDMGKIRLLEVDDDIVKL